MSGRLTGAKVIRRSVPQIARRRPKADELARGKLRIPHHKVKVEDLHKVWETLRAQGDAEYVTVESEDGKIRVLVRGKYLFVQSEESSKDQIQVQIPLQVVDAMFSGQGGGGGVW